MGTFGKYDDEIEVSFKVKGDGKYSVVKILDYLRRMGDIGHSHSVVLDPEGDDTTKVGWDGDGADRISDLKVNGKKLKKDWDKSAAFRLGEKAAAEEEERRKRKKKKCPPSSMGIVIPRKDNKSIQWTGRTPQRHLGVPGTPGTPAAGAV